MRVATRRKSLDRRLVSRPGPPQRGVGDRERTRGTMGVVARRPGRRDASCDRAKARSDDIMNHFMSCHPHLRARVRARDDDRGTSLGRAFDRSHATSLVRRLSSCDARSRRREGRSRRRRFSKVSRGRATARDARPRCAFARDVDTVDAIALDGSNALDREFERGEARESNVSDF